MQQRWTVFHKSVFQTLVPVLQRLPYLPSHACLNLLGRLDLVVVPGQAKLYRDAVASVAKRLGCDWDVAAVSRSVARQTYRWRVRDLLLDRLPDARVASLFRVSGRERLDAALAEGKGVILLANHFGSHVLISHWMFRQGYPVRWLGERPRNVSRYVDRHFETDGPLGQAGLFVSRKGETADGASTVYHAARILRAGLVLKIACDVRWADAKAATAEFLGRVESYSTTWVTLAAMTGAPVVPAFCRMSGDGTFDLEFHEALRIPPDARQGDRAAAWVQAVLRILEDQVRLHPDQGNDYYFWGPASEHGKRSATARPPRTPERTSVLNR